MASPINANFFLMMLCCFAKSNALRLSESTASEEKQATLDAYKDWFGTLSACDLANIYLMEAHSDGGTDPAAVQTGAPNDYFKLYNAGPACSLDGFEMDSALPFNSNKWTLSGDFSASSNRVFDRPSGGAGFSKDNGGKLYLRTSSTSSDYSEYKSYVVLAQPLPYGSAYSATCYPACSQASGLCTGECQCTATYSTADSAGCDPEGVGDPHVTNILGQKMDVNKEGRLPLIKFPRHSGWPNTFVFMEGLVESYGNICAPKFITTINISGTWLRNKKLIFRSAGINSTLPVTVLVDGTNVWPLTDKCNPKTKCSLFKDETLSLKGSANVDNDRVTLTIFGPSDETLQVTITHYTWQVMKKDNLLHYPHLDFKVSNLSHVLAKHDLGGILGQPAKDFKDWIEKPEQCTDRLKLVRLQGPQQRGSTMSAFS